MKIATFIICACFLFEYTNAQEYSRIDSLSILFQAYKMSEFEKQVFNDSQTGDTAIYIMYKPVAKDSIVHAPTHDKYEYLNIYFFPRSYIMGYRLTHWMVIDTFSIADSKANLVYRLVSSSDSWDEGKDVTYMVGYIKLKFQNREWVVASQRIRRM